METGKEVDSLLAAIAERHMRKKEPKKPEHYKTRRKRLLERSRRHEQAEGVAEYRATYRRSLRGRYTHLRRLARQRGWEWNLSYEDWVWMWTMADNAKIGQIEQPAHLAKGRGKEAVHVERLDSKKPFFIVQMREAVSIVQEAPNAGTSFDRDIIRYKGTTRFNCDYIDSRFIWQGSDGSV